jgi:hypothetical protein
VRRTATTTTTTGTTTVFVWGGRLISSRTAPPELPPGYGLAAEVENLQRFVRESAACSWPRLVQTDRANNNRPDARVSSPRRGNPFQFSALQLVQALSAFGQAVLPKDATAKFHFFHCNAKLQSTASAVRRGSIQRSPPRWISPANVPRTAEFIRSLERS